VIIMEDEVNRIFRVRAYGAMGDGQTNDARAIQAAIDDCAQNGGGRVILDDGRTYLASSIIMKSHVDLFLEKDATLKANTDLDRFVSPARIADRRSAPQISQLACAQTDRMVHPHAADKPRLAWIYAYDQDDISISGEGTIVGNADEVTHRVNPYYVTEMGLPRPTLIYLEHCRDVRVMGAQIRKAPFWTLHLAGCEHVVVSGIAIMNDLDCANSDGIDPDHSRDVLIENCRIECADDCIVIKNTRGNIEYGDCSSITVRNCDLVSTSAALKIGTESWGHFHDIDVADCRIARSNRGISLQLRDSGLMENIRFRNITIDTRRFSPEWWGCGEPIAITALARDPSQPVGLIRNILFENIDCDSENGILVYALESGHIENLDFSGIKIRLSVKSKWFGKGYDLRPGHNSGIINRAPVAFLIHNAENVRQFEVSGVNELAGLDLDEA